LNESTVYILNLLIGGTPAIWLKPTNVEAYLRHAEAHYELGNDEQALADTNQTFDLNPWDPFVFALRGKSYQALGRHDVARKAWERAVK